LTAFRGVFFLKNNKYFYAEASDASLTIDAKILSILSATFPRGSDPEPPRAPPKPATISLAAASLAKRSPSAINVT
jgi:hypothetical protein